MYGVTRNPIVCPGDYRHGSCSVITAVPINGMMWLTEDAAGFYPHGYRCKFHADAASALNPQPGDAPPRATTPMQPVVEQIIAEFKAKKVKAARSLRAVA